MSPRIAVRAIILRQGRLLLVNAYAEGSDLWCAPGGGAERGVSLPDNLAREVREETGFEVAVGAPCLVNEFHDPGRGFHQVDVYFRCTVTGGELATGHSDPEGIVHSRRFFSRDEMGGIRYKPDSLPAIAWDDPGAIAYDALEPLVR